MLEGMDRFFMDLPLNPERAHRILDRVNRFRLEFLDRIAPLAGKVHGLYTGDDWGTQRACYISLDHFRAFFKARYRQVIDKAHALGMHVWMHSCGHINEVLQEFIDIGLDVINPQQPLALGIDDISRRYRGRISFEVPADIQKMLPVGMATRAEIEAHVIELIEKWGTPEGGVIGMDYGDYQSIGTTQERAKWAMNVFQDYRY